MNETHQLPLPDTTASENVLEKADALIQRRRVFLAGGRREPVEPCATQIDLPVLTEVVELDATPTQSVKEIPVQLDARRRAAIEQEITHWLDEALPEITQGILDDLADRLVSRIDEEARQQLLPRLLALLDGHKPDGTHSDHNL